MKTRRRTCLSTCVIPPIWIIKSKSVFRIHRRPSCSQIAPRCAEDIAVHGDKNMTLLIDATHTVVHATCIQNSEGVS